MNPSPKLSNDQKHARAAFLAAAEGIFRTGRNFDPIGRGGRWRLKVGNAMVQVFGRYSRDGEWRVNTTSIRLLAEDTSAVIFVDLVDEPAFYLALAGEYERLVDTPEKWSIGLGEIEQWRDRWELLAG